MLTTLTDHLTALGLTLPGAPQPAAAYVSARRAGNLLFIAGQVSRLGDAPPVVGRLGAELDLEQGKAAARICALNILAQLERFVAGDVGQVAGCVRLGGFVNAVPEFRDHPAVIDGASQLIYEVFGEAGRHARAAVGCVSLPRGVAVEVDAIFELVS